MKKTGRVYKRMIITYILVLCIPILLSAVLYQFTYNTVRGQSLYYNENLLETIKSSCDREITYYRTVILQVKVDDDVLRLVKGNKLDQVERQRLFSDIKGTLGERKASLRDGAKYCRDVFIYFSETDELISSGTKAGFDTYLTVEQNMDQNRAEQLKQTVLELEGREMVSVQTKNGEYVLLLEQIQAKTENAGAVVIGVWIDPEVFESRVKSEGWSSGTEWGLVSSTNENLYMTGVLKEASIDLEEIEEGENREIAIDNEEYLVYTVDSEIYEGKYILCSSRKVVGQTAEKIRNMYLLCMFVSVLLGYVVTRVSVRKSYSSVERLMNILPKRGDGKVSSDEFQYLENRVSDLLEKYDDVHENMKKNKWAAQNLAFEKLLLPHETKEGGEVPYTKELYAKFENGTNIVLVFCVKEGIAEAPESSQTMDISLKRFVIANVLAEGIGEKYTQETMEYDEKVVMVVNIPEGEEGSSETLQSLCDKYCGFVEDNFKFRVSTFVGNGYKGVKGIHYSYLEACQAENFGADSDEDYICYNQIDDYTDRKYQYSFELEETVINAVRNGNINLANSLIDNVLEKNYNNKDATLLNCMLYDIYTSLLKVAEEMDVSINKIPLINQVLTKKTLQEAQGWFHEIVKRICAKDAELSNENKALELYQEMLAYIKDNFTNPDLNISQIALEFRMTPTYLSTVFKKQTGKSILDVIRQMRIEYAKELLAKGMSVGEVSDAAGFRESSTFIRAFKNEFGITPGQMKKLI